MPSRAVSAAVLLLTISAAASAAGAGATTAGATTAAGPEVPPARSVWDWSLPENVSSFGEDIDSMFWVITGVCAAVFVITQGILLWCLIAYRARAGGKADHVHGSVPAEIVWTLIPAAILGWLAFHQNDTWKRIKAETPPETDPDVVVVEVLAKQYGWHFRYRGPMQDAEGNPTKELGPFGSKWDLYTDRLYVPRGRKVVFHLNSRDVIHSFFLPHFRVKQDAVPGLAVKGWFDTAALDRKLGAEKLPAVAFRYEDDGSVKVVEEIDGALAFLKPPSGGREYEIVCTELCGPQHFAMNGVVAVMEADDFDRMMKFLALVRDLRMLDGFAGGGHPFLGYDAGQTRQLWEGFKMPADARKALDDHLKAEAAKPKPAEEQ
jgi:cytochrome c oxidase subunit 2